MRLKSKGRKIPFWVQILSIVLAGILATVGVVFYFQDKKIERYTVTFAYGDGTVIEKKEVKSGQGVFPPAVETNGVFRGWSGAINQVKQNIEVHPQIYDIVEQNLFYFDSQYVKEGKKFTLDIYVGGTVSVSSGVLTLEYDPKVISYKSYDGLNFSSVEKTEDGKLLIKFDSDDLLKEKTKLASVTLYAKKQDVYATQVNLSGKEVKVLSGGSEKQADFATINNKIYFLQEVR